MLSSSLHFYCLDWHFWPPKWSSLISPTHKLLALITLLCEFSSVIRKRERRKCYIYNNVTFLNLPRLLGYLFLSLIRTSGIVFFFLIHWYFQKSPLLVQAQIMKQCDLRQGMLGRIGRLFSLFHTVLSDTIMVKSKYEGSQTKMSHIHSLRRCWLTPWVTLAL